MQFYDEVKITVESGKWGNGIASGYRAPGIPRGWPNGGDGGRGGSIVFQASKDEDTLLEFKYKKNYKADNGESGRTKDQYGADAEDLILTVPVETLVKDADTGKVLHHFTRDGEEWTALPGGSGGKGNIHFKDSVRQFPNFFLLWEPGHKKELILELQLLGDVGLIGNPSVGKSSLINCVSSTKAKVADYPFTTLIPNLGSVTVGDFRFNMVDIPGLIKGASDGKGLGNDFLRHVLKARLFAMVADLSRYDKGIWETLELFDEIKEYIEEKILDDEGEYYFAFEQEENLIAFNVYANDELLISKKILFVLNKCDLVNDDEVLEEYKKQFVARFSLFLEEHQYAKLSEDLIRNNLFVTSAGTMQGIEAWKQALARLLQRLPAQEMPDVEPILPVEADEEDMIVDVTEEEKPWLIEHDYLDEVTSTYLNVYLVQNPEVCRLVFITPWGNDEAEMWFWKQLQQKGFIELLEAEGMRKGDVLKIKSYYEGLDDRYIVY